MRNTEMAKRGALVGEWSMTMSEARFLEPPGTRCPVPPPSSGSGSRYWSYGSVFGGGRHVHSEMSLVLGRSDPNDQFVALYQDDRDVCRHYAMTFDGGHWTMTREDPYFHQRFLAAVEKDRIFGRWQASEDAGKTWRKDYDLTFERA
jgi:hypothetical protein